MILKFFIFCKDTGKFTSFQLGKLSAQFHNRYYPGWKIFETTAPPHGRNVSWEAFVKYVAANKGDKMMNHHWKAQFNQCRICQFNYEYITHLEHNSDEADLYAKKLAKEKNITLVHPFDDEEVIAGQGTVGLEMLEDFPDFLLLFNDSNKRSRPRFSSGIKISSAPAPIPTFKAI